MNKNTLSEEDFNNLITTYGTDILRLCYLYLKDYQLAEDACQETFIKVYKNFYSFNGHSSMKTWITRICINTCKNHLRNSWFKKIVLSSEKIINAEVSDKDVFEDLNKSDLFSSIMKLKPKYKDIILMYYYQQLSTKEIAEILEITEANVSTRLFRARKKLKNDIGGVIYE
jgi:RNA polymerase sigma-70 factor (ECF subfamily)